MWGCGIVGLYGLDGVILGGWRRGDVSAMEEVRTAVGLEEGRRKQDERI